MLRKSLIAVALSWLVTMPALADPSLWRAEWPKTDFDKTTVDNWSEIRSGGPPKDGIPALDDVAFVAVTQAQGIGDREPVITVAVGGEVPRAYPIRYLTWHEIVNDRIGAVPVAVTFCPLCNSGRTFDRRVNGRVLSFGVTGKLRASDMVMYDRQTESWWQQFTGEAIVGTLLGTRLDVLVSWMEPVTAFEARNPTGAIMQQPRRGGRAYGRNPYVGYDSSSRPFLYRGELPPHGIAPLARVVRVGDRAWTLERLRAEETVSEAGVTLSWRPGQASALDTARIDAGRDVGSIRVRDGQGRDIPHDVMFAFAFHAFWPDGNWMLAPN